ncbi:hypothetical protein PVAP13_1NG108444 [Panicum virgatum]|uniref:Uncharacterized protein n=1 Tax=Panicum virgatum TaxID=38727 RepID=A0A8T0WW99_PANVG|nr:hypothetical protein PVAP13_1NG108444 [Panicum virgatum]
MSPSCQILAKHLLLLWFESNEFVSREEQVGFPTIPLPSSVKAERPKTQRASRQQPRQFPNPYGLPAAGVAQTPRRPASDLSRGRRTILAARRLDSRLACGGGSVFGLPEWAAAAAGAM